MVERRGEADRELRELFARLGYDISDMDDVRTLGDNLRWVTLQRERATKRSQSMSAGAWSVLSALAGTIVGFLANLLIGHGGAGH